MHSIRPWPAPADPAAAQRLHERFAATGPEEAAFAATPDGEALLAAIGGGSPFLSDLAVREHAALLQMAAAGPEEAIAREYQALACTTPAASRAQVMAALRRCKRRVALVTALADIGGVWRLAQVTAALTHLAEATLRLAVDHLLLAAHAAGSLRLPHPDVDPAQGSGLIVLGMGKLGAGELNYSSDIDLVLLYDPDAHPDPDRLGATFTRIARALVTIMETRDADGYVFRTDLRLRPDPAATPPVVAVPAAIAYYESLGQNWERAAMTKARPVAGCLKAGEAFLRAVRPFVWRRHLDFAAIADLHAMKRRIDVHRGFAPAGTATTLAGTNLKLAPGGIREIEFIVQTLQLVWGGRDPVLRDRTTLGGLRGLVRAGHLGRRVAAELTVAYRVLRRTEHRLQMVADRQTHAIPEREDELARFALFAGAANPGALAALLGTQMDRVRLHYAAVFETVPGNGEDTLDLAGRDVPAATATRLAAFGFQNVGGMVATMRGWQAGRLRATRSERARDLLTLLLPALLAALGTQADPDAAFARFDSMLSRQASGVHLLSTLHRNPAVLQRIAAVLGAAPSLADHLASLPAALEGLLHPDQAAPVLADRLSDATTPEDVVTVTSAFVRAEEFRLCCAQMEGGIDVDAAGFARTALADAALAALLPVVLAEHARRYGTIRGGDVAVVALGKAGSAEMMAGSDLDLMLLYTHPPGVTESTGSRPVPVSQWFIRAAHAFVAALTAPGRDGPLYQVDMRLRPSGNKGPVAVPLAGFVRYHASEAWTWERMTLTRARVVAGHAAIRARVEAAIARSLAIPLDRALALADAADMRRRLMRELPPSGPWDVKMRKGGGMEVEFVAQVLQLVDPAATRHANTEAALGSLALAGALPSSEADALIRADRLWRTVQSIIRITVGRNPTTLPAPAQEILLRTTATLLGRPGLDLPTLHATLDEVAREVRATFNSRVGDIGP